MTNEEEQKNIVRYTKRTRLKKNRDRLRSGLSAKIVTACERLFRTAAYSLLRYWYRNEQLQKSISLSEVRSILIIPYGDAIGDLIVASGIWTSIKRRKPDCKVGVFVSTRNASLIRDNPFIDRTYYYSGRRDIMRLTGVRRAKLAHYDLILNLHFTHQSDYGFLANYIGKSAIKLTADHPRRALYEIFFNHIGRRKRHTCSISHFSLELLSEGVDFSPPLKLAEAWPVLNIPQDRPLRIEGRLREMNIVDSKFIVINIQAATPFREWGIENSIAFASEFLAEFPLYSVLLIAGPLQHDKLEAAMSVQADERIHFFKTTNDLLELAALIQMAELVVTPETAITHFASAVKTAVVVLLPNQEHLPIEWLPVGIPARLIAPRAQQSVATILIADVLTLAISIVRQKWTATQTSLGEQDVPHPMFQSVNGNRLLSEFASEVLSPT